MGILPAHPFSGKLPEEVGKASPSSRLPQTKKEGPSGVGQYVSGPANLDLEGMHSSYLYKEAQLKSWASLVFSEAF